MTNKANSGSLDDALSTMQVAQEQPLPKLNLLIPAGLSFYTFSCLSYWFDVYRLAHSYIISANLN